MKTQLTRLSPHQNAKVFAVLSAIGSLFFMVPLLLLFAGFGPPGGRLPFGMMLAAPVFYLIFGYVFTVIGCAIYNLMFRYIGGIEFETRHDQGS